MGAGFLSLAGGLLGSYLDYRNNQRTNNTNWNMQHETNMMNMQMNQQNIDMQRAENAINRAREDDAIRRRANDLTGAGLSKTLAAGSPASANAMQAPQNTMPMQSTKFQAYTGFGSNFNKALSNAETAAYHRKQAEIAEQELDLKGTELDIAQQEADEKKRHNEVSEEHEASVIEENKRFHDIENEWKQAELEQNAQFHQDSMDLAWAKQALDERLGLSEIENKEHQNIWYDTQVELSKHEDKRAFMLMTAQLAESDAKIGLYLSEKHLNQEQIDYLKKESKYLGALTAERIASAKHLDAQTKDILASSYTKLYNLWMAYKDHTTTTGHVVSDSEATQNAANRHSTLRNTLISVGISAVGIGVMTWFKSGAPGRIRQKAFYEDHRDWYDNL